MNAYAAVVRAGLLLVLLGPGLADAARFSPSSPPRDARPRGTGVPTRENDQGTPRLPPLTGPVVDRAGVLTAAAAEAVTSLALELRAKTGAEIAVLTVETTAPLAAFDYGQQVADAWKLGQAGKDNGLLLLVAVRDRQVRFFTGYGLEGILPDGRLGRILDTYVTPRFRNNDYDGGVYAGLRAAAEVIAADAGVRLTEQPAEAPQPVGPADLAPLLLFLGFFVLSVYLARKRRLRGGFVPIFFGGGLGGGFGGGFGGRGGFGGGGFGGGGFGGGGRFGGGGAGRGW